MSTISSFMQNHHRECDEILIDAESAVSKEDWPTAKEAWSQFVLTLEYHITEREEGILFPAVEAVIGPMGPTQVMRGEHEQMRDLVTHIGQSIEASDKAQVLGLIDTLMILIQQHNMKEEQMLYPMMDNSIEDIEGTLSKIKG